MPDIYFKRAFQQGRRDVGPRIRRRRDHHRSRTWRASAPWPCATCGPRRTCRPWGSAQAGKNPSPPASPGESGSYWLRGWEIIPVENLLAQPAVAGKLAVEAASLAEARLAAGVLECGVPVVVVLPEALASLKNIVSGWKLSQGTLTLDKATITEVKTVGLGHRVCVDTLTLMERGRGCWWATPAPSPSLRTPKRSTTNMWRRGLSASTRAACTPMR